MTDGGHREELERLRRRVLELEALTAEEGAAHQPVSFGPEAHKALLGETERIAHIGSFAWDVPTDSIYWSDELYRIFGHAPGSIQPSQDAFFSTIHPADLDKVRAGAAATLRTGIGHRVDYRVVRPDGSIRYVRLDGAAVLDTNGQPTRFVGAISDNTETVVAETELRRSEALLRHGQRIAKTGSFEWDVATNQARWSDELYRIVGLDPREPPDPERYFSMVHPDDQASVMTDQAAAARGADVPPHNYRLIRPDGAIVQVHVEVHAIRDTEGRVQSYYGIVRDDTERHQLEAQLAQAQKMDALGRLAGGIAHDFNNLLTVIGMHVNLLERRRHDRELGEIAGAVQRAATMTRQLLAFSRHSVVSPTRIDPVAAIGTALQMVRRLIGDQVEIAFSHPEHVDMVDADVGQLEQLLLNLMLNARDALPNGGTVRVTVERTTLGASAPAIQPPVAPGDYVVLRVADNGTGMSEEVQRRAFEPYFTTKELGRGTGLGLAMVFGIASQWGGGVSLRSSPASGTEFSVYVPATQGAAAQAEGAHSTDAHAPGAGELVLLVDDDVPVRDVLAAVLVEAGYRVHATSDGVSALAFVDTHGAEIALILADVVMPGMRGPELVRRVRQQLPTLPALFMTGYASEDLVEQTASLGGLLTKPFSPDELVARVAPLVARGRERAVR